MTGRRLILSVLALVAWWTPAPSLTSAAPGVTFPAPTGYVNDLANLLDPAQRTQLEDQLSRFDQTTGNQIAVAIFPGLHGVPITQFTVQLEEAWKVGRKGKDNGVLVLVAVKERMVRIEIGYGLESRITDTDAGAIIRDTIAPAFRAGQYGDGLLAAADRLIGLIEIGPSGAPPGGGAPGSSPVSPSAPPAAGVLRWSPGGVGLLPIILFLAFLALSLGVSRARVARCPRCGMALQVSDQRAGASGTFTSQAWVCPRCGYREKRLLAQGASPGPLWLAGPGWGTGGFGAGASGGFGGFGGGSSGGGGATGGW